jgi:hypothetical protein
LGFRYQQLYSIKKIHPRKSDGGMEIDRATFSTQKGGKIWQKKLVKKGEIGINLHAGTPRKGLAKQDRPFWNIYRTDSFGDDLED